MEKENYIEEKQNIRQFSKKYFPEERQRLAREIKVKRKEHFDRRQELSEEILTLVEVAKKKESAVEEVISKIKELEEKLMGYKRSKTAELRNYFKIKKYQEEIKIKETSKAQIESEYLEVKGLLEDLHCQQNDKRMLDDTKKLLDDFYSEQSDEWQVFKEEQQIGGMAGGEEESVDNFALLSSLYSQCEENWRLNETKDRSILDAEFSLEAEQFLESLNDAELLELNDRMYDEWTKKSIEMPDDLSEETRPRTINSVIVKVVTKRDNAATRKAYDEWVDSGKKAKWRMPSEKKRFSKKIDNELSGIKKVGVELPFEHWDIPSGIENVADLLKDKSAKMIDWENLLLVRAGSAPLNFENEKVVCKLPKRERLHWTLNYPVTAHNDGSWAFCKYLIFTPAEEVFKKNGPPLVLNHVDTFWADKDLELPPESVILLREGSGLPNQEELEKRVALVKYPPNFYLKQKLVLEVIERLGYTVLPGGMWADYRVQRALEPLIEKYAMGASQAHVYEDSPDLMEGQKRRQADFLKE